MINLRGRKGTVSGPHIPITTFPLSTTVPPLPRINLLWNAVPVDATTVTANTCWETKEDIVCCTRWPVHHVLRTPRPSAYHIQKGSSIDHLTSRRRLQEWIMESSTRKSRPNTIKFRRRCFKNFVTSCMHINFPPHWVPYIVVLKMNFCTGGRSRSTIRLPFVHFQQPR